jgi:hypothetical protein
VCVAGLTICCVLVSKKTSRSSVNCSRRKLPPAISVATPFLIAPQAVRAARALEGAAAVVEALRLKRHRRAIDLVAVARRFELIEVRVHHMLDVGFDHQLAHRHRTEGAPAGPTASSLRRCPTRHGDGAPGIVGPRAVRRVRAVHDRGATTAVPHWQGP